MSGESHLKCNINNKIVPSKTEGVFAERELVNCFKGIVETNQDPNLHVETKDFLVFICNFQFFIFFQH